MTEFQNHLIEFFQEGKNKFFKRETDNILFGVSERNLCGRLSTYFELLLPKYGLEDYYSDPEYNRKQNGEIKTILDDNMDVVSINFDLIVYSRGYVLPNDNLLALEMKKSNYSGRIGNDEFKAQLGVVWRKEVILEIIKAKMKSDIKFQMI